MERIEGDLCGKIEEVLVVSQNFAIALGKNYRSMQRIIQSKYDSSLLHIMDALMKDLGLRMTLDEIKLTKATSVCKPISTHGQSSLQHHTQNRKTKELKSQPKNENSEKRDIKESHGSNEQHHSQKNPVTLSSKPVHQSVVNHSSVVLNPPVPSTNSGTAKQFTAVTTTSVASNSTLVSMSGNSTPQTPVTAPISTSTEMKSAVVNAQEMSSSMVGIENQKLFSNTDLIELHKCYSDIVRNLPYDFMESVQQLQHILSDEQISSILECTSPLAANQMLTDCLIEKVENKANILDLCEYLGKIKNAQNLKCVVEQLRKEVISSLTQGSKNTSIEVPVTSSSELNEANSSMICIENQQLLNNNDLKELHKCYSDIVRSLPDDFMESVQQLQHILSDEQITSILECTSSLAANQMLTNCLIEKLENKANILDLCELLNKIKNSPKLQNTIEHLRKDVLSSLMQGKRNASAITSSSEQQEKEPSLTAFDRHYDLMMLVNPRYVKHKFVAQDFFPNGDPYTDNATFLPNEVKMEGMLKTIRNSIAVNGNNVFIQLIEVFHSEVMYAALGDKLIETYRAFGGDAQLETCTNELFEQTESYVMSDAELEKKLKWHNKQLQNGLLYQPPPPLPPNYIPRIQLLDVITEAVISNNVDPSVSTTVTLLGFGGFGKTTLATGLCHQPKIQQHFLDGVLWIKLGPKPPDPEMMLIKLYDQLTNEKLQQINFSMADKLRWYVTSYLQRLLVIIDDVWDARDAEIYVNNFSTCKIVLTTRRRNVSTHIPTKTVIEIEEMSIEESKILLTHRVVDTDKLNSSAIEKLETLAQNLHRWPLLLGLVRNQLHSQIELQAPINQAICKVEQALYDKGLTAFDSNIESRSSKENAVKACVDATLDLLTQKELSNLKILVLYAGMGVKIPKSSLNYFWSDDVDDNLEKLSSCGLIAISRMALPPSICTLPCVEMHAVTTQYLIDSMDFGTLKQIFEGMNIANMQFMDWGFDSPEIMEDIAFDLMNKIDFEVLQSDEKERTIFQLQFSIGFIDNLGIPFSIQRVVILTKIIQQNVVEKLELFSEHFKQHPQLLSLLIKFKAENTLKVEKAYMRFIKTYKEIQSFLALHNFAGVMNALKGYIEEHPVQLLVKKFFKLTQELMQSCKGDDSLLSFIMENTGIDNEKRNEYGLEGCVSCFEHQIKTRFAFTKLNKPNITMEEYLDTTLDLCFGHLKWFDANVINQNKELFDQLESFDPKNEDVKASFDALITVFSNMFERHSGLKTAMAEWYNVDENLPLQDFILSMVKRYVQATPRTM